MAKTLLRLEYAVESLLAVAGKGRARDVERLALTDALGRVAVGTTTSRLDQPPFNRSPLDGYAIHHEDLAGAGPQNPARLVVTPPIFAGDAGDERLERGRAARIFTGAPIPPGATCVVRQEDVVLEDGMALVPLSLREFENYSFRGESVKAGTPLVHAGDRLDPGRVALLAGNGETEVAVFARPRVIVISTGNELAAGGKTLGPGEIYDSNRHLLTALALEQGATVIESRVERDDPARIADAMRDALGRCDLLLTTGGVSVGDHDYLPDAGKRAGLRQIFHGVQVKPGTPALGLEKDGTLALCLSGNPFAAFITFHLLAAPVLRHLAGRGEARSGRVGCVLAEPFPKGSAMRRFVPGRLVGGDVFFGGGAANRSSSSFADVNCLVDIPPAVQGLEAGNRVEAVLL